MELRCESRETVDSFLQDNEIIAHRTVPAFPRHHAVYARRVRQRTFQCYFTFYILYLYKLGIVFKKTYISL